MKDLTKEQLMEEMLKTKQDHQLKMMEELYDKIDHLGQKAIKTSYKASQEERALFGKIVLMINNINKWF